MHAFKILALIILIAFFNSKNLLSAEGMPQFNAETFPSQLFWLVITFVSLYICMNFLILPRIRNNIRLRKNKISNDIERAELLKEQIEKTVNEYNLKIMQAKNQADENTRSAVEKANQDFNTQLDNVKKRILQKINKSEEEIKSYKKNIEKEIHEASVNISSRIVEKVIGKGLSKSDIDYINKETSKVREI
jgi:F-type H+-transporting ATPase subunit b